MRIALVAAGAGAMYCGACARDVALLRGLRALGHEALALPLYTPLKSDLPPQVPMAPLFLGGISLYLRQAGRLAAALARPLRPVLDHPAVLRLVARRAVETDPAGLGPMTVAVLAGDTGPHAAEGRRLADYLAQDFHPDVVHLSNTLLSGLAPAIKTARDVPVVATLQGEELFIEALPEPHRAEAIARLRRNARAVDHFIACAAARVPVLCQLLEIESNRITVVPTGIEAAPFRRTAPPPACPFTIGYLSGIRPAKGLDVLVQALQRLGPEVRLAVAGQVQDRRFARKVREAVSAGGLSDRVAFHGELDLAGKVAFLHGLDVFAFPTRLPESRAVAVLEALAAGVPVVASHLGVLPELLSTTGGGITVPPEDPAALAEALGELAAKPERRQALAAAAASVESRYPPAAMVAATAAVYDAAIAAGAGKQKSPG